jgi:N-acyl homoserine lactone hydrolase
MTNKTRLWPLLTATHRYEKTLSTHGRGAGQMIDAPILAYLIETSNGRILYDVGCDYRKINEPAKRDRYYHPDTFHFGAPVMTEEQRIPSYLKRLGLSPQDIDVVFIGHLHFDHAGGLGELKACGCCADVHVQADELAAAQSGEDIACFDDEVSDAGSLRVMHGEYELCTGVAAISTPGHTAGHMSLWIELPKGPPVLLAGDAADLMENIKDEVAPGACWENRFDQAVDSIRKLKRIAMREQAQLWPNHDMAFFRSLAAFPAWQE